ALPRHPPRLRPPASPCTPRLPSLAVASSAITTNSTIASSPASRRTFRAPPPTSGRKACLAKATVAPGVGLASDIASSQSTDWLGTVRGRLGFLFTPTLLVYGTGGFAYGQTNANTHITQYV